MIWQTNTVQNISLGSMHRQIENEKSRIAIARLKEMKIDADKNLIRVDFVDEKEVWMYDDKEIVQFLSEPEILQGWSAINNAYSLRAIIEYL